MDMPLENNYDYKGDMSMTETMEKTMREASAGAPEPKGAKP
jgi:hypothetical protein